MINPSVALRVTYRMREWPAEQTAVWIARDQQWIDWVSLLWPSFQVISVEVA